MTFIIGDKMYDTETSKKVIKYLKGYPVLLSTGTTIYFKRKTQLYITKKGNWFSVGEKNFDEYIAYQENEESVKELLSNLNAIDIYNKHFEKLEEA